MSARFCLTFADGAQCVTFGAVPTGGQSALTAETWARVDALGEMNRPVVAQWDGSGWALYLTTDGRLYFYVATGDGIAVAWSAVGAVHVGLWQHLAGTWDGATGAVAVFVDGIDVTEDSLPALGSVGSSTAALQLAGRLFEDEIGFVGRAGWGRVSSTVRYADGFTTVQEYPAVDAATLCQWHLSEGTGTVTDNAQGNPAYDGVISGATWGWWPVTGSRVLHLRRRSGRPMWA